MAATGLVAAFAQGVSAMPPGSSVPGLVTQPQELRPVHDLDCLSVEQVKNEYTPPDLMAAYVRCAHAGRYDDAMLLRMIAGTYSYFDTLRVLDPSSHNAFWVLTQYYPPDSDDIAKLRAAGGKYADLKSPESMKLCDDLKRLGPPNYHPDYMIGHGLSASYSSGPFTADIEVHSAWKETLGKYARCDASDLP
jgi:hypothetical protein